MIMLLQPEKRHYELFPLWKRQYPNAQFQYILHPTSTLTESQHSEDILVFNSWGFTKFALKNIKSILTYRRILLMVHSGARFSIDVKRIDYKKLSTIYFLIRAILDFAFLLYLSRKCRLEVYSLDNNVKQYLISKPIGKFLKNVKSIEFKTLKKKTVHYLEKGEIDICAMSGKNILMIGEFDEKRINAESLSDLLDLITRKQIKLSINVIGSVNKLFKKKFLNYKCLKFHGYVTDATLAEYVKDCHYILTVNKTQVCDYGFIDQYFVTKASGSILLDKPIIKW